MSYLEVNVLTGKLQFSDVMRDSVTCSETQPFLKVAWLEQSQGMYFCSKSFTEEPYYGQG